MGIGISIFLIAVGAILTFAVDGTVQGVNLDAAGWILMIVGAAGLLWALIAAATARPAAARDGHVVYEEEPRY